MPRKRYIKLVRKRERVWLARREKELKKLAAALRSDNTEETVLPVVNTTKEHRQVRLGHKQRHKSPRPSADEPS